MDGAEMVQKVIHSTLSDLDGSPADETVQLVLDGRGVQLDLSTGQAEELRALLAPYFAAGQLVAPRAGKKQPARTDYDAVRTWCQANGVPVSRQGRIGADALKAYDNRSAGGGLAVVS
jgi:hypothetical protein